MGRMNGPRQKFSEPHTRHGQRSEPIEEDRVDIYFSADVETDGPIPGPYSLLSFALVYAGKFDGHLFERPRIYDHHFYRELKPISDSFEPDALRVNRLDRDRLCREGDDPSRAMSDASHWVKKIAGANTPVLVAYPLSFDWTWLYWYFVKFSDEGSPFRFSNCFDIKTAYSVKARIPVAAAGRSKLVRRLHFYREHTHNALDDAVEQAELFAQLYDWKPGDAPTSS
jgi:hypothetical protein